MIIAVKPGSINDADKAALVAAGHFVIVMENPEDVRVISEEAIFPTGDVIMSLLKAIHGSSMECHHFVKELYGRLNKPTKQAP